VFSHSSIPSIHPFIQLSTLLVWLLVFVHEEEDEEEEEEEEGKRQILARTSDT
jgi:hypothetical protein